MSKKNYDSEFCGSLPLHHINQIQPYGYLVVLSKEDLKIVQASENVSEVFGKDVADVVDSNLSDFVSKEQIKMLEASFAKGISDKIPLNLNISIGDIEVEYIALVHMKETLLVAELEKADTRKSFLEVYQEMKYVMAEVNSASSIETICQISVSALRKLAGFDRVLMYQFDSDWNGTVIAEERELDMEPYIGLKFPASDIPKQARALYHKNTYRLIPNREDKPVKVYPVINPLTNSFIDLTDCNLRSVAGVHLEYMENMGIKASMSIRIIRNGQLWALISCHHREAKYLNYEVCSVFELLSELISSKITSMLYQEQFEYKSTLWEKKRLVLDGIYSVNELFSGLVKKDNELLELFSAGGLALVYKGKVHLQGKTPQVEDVKHLVFWLQHKMISEAFVESNLSSTFEPAQNFIEEVSGLLAIPIGGRNEDFLLLFRPEVQTTVSWGGNPSEAIRFEPDGKKYHPRNSFSIWQETVKGTSLPWSGEEVRVAESLRSFIFEYSTKYIYS
ncbi:GAF domain-containing protein [Desertivirga brevis]|uniref:GAF domain-containing protein n=1 Tax=Desertivirga brevis TaxID=2810310 RepID=UPI001A95EF23|nr:GAF domain-containing protein [Pedobacter sp. SYSU D00873]